MLDRPPTFQLALAIRDAVDAVAEAERQARQADGWPTSISPADRRQAQLDVQRMLCRLIYLANMVEAKFP
jgi:hypothetical protein